MPEILNPLTSEQTFKAWTTQRIANRLPSWSRARQSGDSVFQSMVNPIGQNLDLVYRSLIEIRNDYYVSSTDLNAAGYAYVMNLPNNFLFAERPAPSGFMWDAPQINAVVNGLPVTITPVAPEASWTHTDKNFLAPTRIGFTPRYVGVQDELLPAIAIGTLGSIAVPGVWSSLASVPSRLWIDIDGGQQFGGEDSKGNILEPKVIIYGTPSHYDFGEEYAEHLPFLSNTELPTLDAWSALDGIETRGIFENSTTIRVSRGFKKDFVPEPLGLWVDPLQESRLFYQIGHATVSGYGELGFLQWTIPEFVDSDLQSQGFSDRTVMYESLLTKSPRDSNPAVYVTQVIAMDRMPFSPWLVAVTQDQLCFYPAWMPPVSGTLLSSTEPVAFNQYLRETRTPSPELVLEVGRNWVSLAADTLNGFEVSTRHAGETLNIDKVRISIVSNFDGPQPQIDYIDWDGALIVGGPSQAWLYNPKISPDPNRWQDRSIFIDITAFNPSLFMIVLETQLRNGTTQKDSVVVSTPVLYPQVSFSLEAPVLNKVAGLKFDYLGRLLILLTTVEVHEVDLSYDYGVVDYRTNVIYLREPYDSVTVESGP